MNTCCESFEELLANAGGAGLSVIVRQLGDEIAFALQSRACSFDQEGLLQEIPPEFPLPNPLRVMDQVGIQFCPFCGTHISAKAQTNGQGLEALVELHRQFVAGPHGSL